MPTENSEQPYLASVSKQLECPALIAGGVEDHVHLLARLARTISQADWVKELKCVSSLWLKEQHPEFADFAWQNGYAIFSVSASNLDRVTAYINAQEQHHQRLNFQDELRAFLRRHKLDWDERYVWD